MGNYSHTFSTAVFGSVCRTWLLRDGNLIPSELELSQPRSAPANDGSVIKDNVCRAILCTKWDSGL